MMGMSLFKGRGWRESALLDWVEVGLKQIGVTEEF